MKRTIRIALAAAALLTVVGCASNPEAPPPTTTEPATQTRTLPTFSELADRHNRRVANVQRFRTTHATSIRYTDENGDQQREQFEGGLQVRAPTDVAYSIKKAGQRIAWLGCDDERGWWLQLREDKQAVVGPIDEFEQEVERQIGIPIGPEDLIAALGVVPLNPDTAGGTQWSRDKRSIGLTSQRDDGSYIRLWLDPQSTIPHTVELINPDGRTARLVARLTRREGIGLSNTAAQLPFRVEVQSATADWSVRLSLDEPRRNVSDDAFSFEALTEQFRIERIDRVGR